MYPAFSLMHAADTLSLLRMVFCATKLNHDTDNTKYMNYEFKKIEDPKTASLVCSVHSAAGDQSRVVTFAVPHFKPSAFIIIHTF